jgi:hypothetical protein
MVDAIIIVMTAHIQSLSRTPANRQPSAPADCHQGTAGLFLGVMTDANPYLERLD